MHFRHFSDFTTSVSTYAFFFLLRTSNQTARMIMRPLMINW